MGGESTVKRIGAVIYIVKPSGEAFVLEEREGKKRKAEAQMHADFLNIRERIGRRGSVSGMFVRGRCWPG